MDLPPLSFHASLEEKWDEEEETEEIKTVMKVVPPAYHQYLDVFSEVKAEKLPSNCACDNHNELEGLQPPVGVIYSLSHQESEPLQPYISENVEKGLIRPSSSSTGAPVLFSRKRMEVFVCVLTTANSMLSLEITGILFLLGTSFLLYSMVPLSSPR
ncbi:hypothetical protein O181_035344 [Austropuccinia psidii MF-1]|uniref:Uncharacterized protein n=1 Tax=Austropuccinia psidii MF-1 TaxID=1389203 RepID=A0A9Q3D2J4_9BASI|nr:hypothetical protein [Austropuccinia psidii MF-1]